MPFVKVVERGGHNPWVTWESEPVIFDRRSVADGKSDPPRVGAVVAGTTAGGVKVLDADGHAIVPIEQYLRHLVTCDMSLLTCRSYAFDLRRWFRLMWCFETPWDASTPADAEVLVSWMRNTSNYQRGHDSSGSGGPGSVNPKTGKPSLSSGFAPRTINHALSVVHQFYEFHSSFGDGPVVNPVPGTTANWWDSNGSESFRSTWQQYPRRGRLRQKVPRTLPRAIPDSLWDELFLSMNCTRDRALLSLYVSSGARASELLTLRLADVG
ncbi:hypothetical protein IWX65_003555 [Arthrobacter sp. CAN_A214]|uniref:hypothetical protein n=1 Tax=Arthrobacter sp. CAN_A214 TaxID=2787720 RepID=UPI0018CB35C3